jgi:hypothetical protein
MRVFAILLLLCCSLRAADSSNAPSPYEDLAKRYGWSTNVSRGKEIVQKLAALSPEELQKVDITAYRGERVAFVGGVAPPGGSNDLVTGDGFYLRVVNKSGKGKDLRPHSAWWEVMICGKILQVLPQNRIIVIEVDEKDWKIIQTG